ncbi:hypothetical protein [Cryobacterium sp. PAMC25264]|uniref:hypothetical protein n=1 Tax=Cryobacterium sp. PAMC25264 TaxID=2861288 RepID=UPI002102BDB0|nr:hypothetical protein [Cryobacterium sp. PAMC25264]
MQKRLGSAISIGLYLIFAVLVLQRAGLATVLPWPVWWPWRSGCWRGTSRSGS